jgi:hypothetical protein
LSVPPQPLENVVEHCVRSSVHAFLAQQLLLASLQFGIAPLQQIGPPQTVPVQPHVLVEHVKPVSVHAPQFVVRPLPEFVSVLQLPPGAPASSQTGGPLQKNPASTPAPASATHA